jgi:hypothetical protein
VRGVEIQLPDRAHPGGSTIPAGLTPERLRRFEYGVDVAQEAAVYPAPAAESLRCERATTFINGHADAREPPSAGYGVFDAERDPRA